MSQGDVVILNTKLDILIDDFKDFKKYAIGFVMTIAVPLAVYIIIQLIDAKTDIAVMQEKIIMEQKAIKEEQ